MKAGPCRRLREVSDVVTVGLKAGPCRRLRAHRRRLGLADGETKCLGDAPSGGGRCCGGLAESETKYMGTAPIGGDRCCGGLAENAMEVHGIRAHRWGTTGARHNEGFSAGSEMKHEMCVGAPRPTMKTIGGSHDEGSHIESGMHVEYLPIDRRNDEAGCSASVGSAGVSESRSGRWRASWATKKLETARQAWCASRSQQN